MNVSYNPKFIAIDFGKMSLNAAVNEALLHVGEAAFLEKRTNATAHTDCAFKPDSADMIVDALCSERASKKIQDIESGNAVHQPILSTDGTFGSGFESGLLALAKIAKEVTPTCGILKIV